MPSGPTRGGSYAGCAGRVTAGPSKLTLWVAGALVAAPWLVVGAAAQQKPAVDVELVLAVDDAVLQKLVLEVAESGPQIGEVPPLVLVQGGPFLPGPKYAPECDIGERLRMLYMSDARI